MAYSAIERNTIYQNVMNSDIVHQIDTVRTYVNGLFSGAQVNEITASYLPNPNPFYQVLRATAKNYITGLGIGNLSNSEYASTHLISQQTASGADKITYNYILRADGYPLSAIVTLERNGSKSTTKLLFVYMTN